MKNLTSAPELYLDGHRHRWSLQLATCRIQTFGLASLLPWAFLMYSKQHTHWTVEFGIDLMGRNVSLVFSCFRD